jgi:hypothetical protein
VSPPYDADEVLLDVLIEDKEPRINEEQYKEGGENAEKFTGAVKINSTGGDLDDQMSATPTASTPSDPPRIGMTVTRQQPSPPTAELNTATPYKERVCRERCCTSFI